MLGRQCIFLLALLCGISLLRADEVTHFFDESLAPEESFSFAVLAQRGDLAFTGYLAEKSKSKQAIELLDELLAQNQSTRADVLRLNLHFLPAPENRAEAVAFVAKHWPAGESPAVTLIPGTLPEGITFACDAVFLSRGGSVSNSESVKLVPGSKSILYASGRVARGKTLDQSIPEAMQLILDDYLQPNGVDFQDAVQVRAYLPDLSEWPKAKKGIGKLFGKYPLPPMIPIEWAREETVEIEVIASMESGPSDAPVEYQNPAEMKPSPAFTRVAIVHAGEITFFSGIAASTTENAEAGVRAVFKKQWEALAGAQSDAHHLVKATYMVASPESDKAVSAIRPDFLDPSRPPSASKVMRQHAGKPGEDFQLDLIAVPRQ